MWKKNWILCFGMSVAISATAPTTAMGQCEPTLLGAYDTPEYAGGVFVSGTTAFVADDWKGDLQIIDVTDPTQPTLLGSYDTPGNAWGVFVSGTTAFVADWDGGLQIIDVTDPTQPTLLGSYGTPDNAWGVFVSGTTAFVADRRSGLQIINVSGCLPSCSADLNGDGVVNTQDFIAFLGAWSSGDPLADWNGDGTVNTQDFLAYLTDWTAGC